MSGKGTFSLKEMRLPIPTTLFIYISTIFYRNYVPNILCSLFSCMSNRPLGLSIKYCNTLIMTPLCCLRPGDSQVIVSI